MADSKINSDDSSKEDLADDLDAILNDLGPSNEDQDELIDDEDAIDRLLMDDALDDSETEKTNDDVGQTINKKLEEDSSPINTETKNEEFDEFSEDEPSESSTEGSVSISNETDKKAEVDKDDFDVDDLINSTVPDSKIEEDELAEIGELNDKNNSVDTEQQEESVSEEIDNEFVEDSIEPDSQSDDDFLMADFDISTEDELGQANVETENLVENVETENEEENTPVVSSVINENIEKNNAALAEITAQISQLCLENETLKQQIDELNSSTEEEDPTAAEIETLQKEQRKLRRIIKENEAKIPVITYVAIGIAILALLIGGGLGAIGYGAQTDVTELISTLEEEIELLSTKDASTDINKINEQISLLTANDDHTNNKIDQVKQTIQSNPIKPVIDDLVKQNDQAKVAIDQLLAKVESLEKRKVVSTVRKKPKKVVAKVTWVVNLVSFRQEWYAKRKAEEFEKKAVPAEVIKVKVKGEDWFRLRVIGFKTKYEAAAYAVKVKKVLNLSSVWVTKA